MPSDDPHRAAAELARVPGSNTPAPDTARPTATMACTTALATSIFALERARHVALEDRPRRDPGGADETIRSSTRIDVLVVPCRRAPGPSSRCRKEAPRVEERRRSTGARRAPRPSCARRRLGDTRAPWLRPTPGAPCRTPRIVAAMATTPNASGSSRRARASIERNEHDLAAAERDRQPADAAQDQRARVHAPSEEASGSPVTGSPPA